MIPQKTNENCQLTVEKIEKLHASVGSIALVQALLHSAAGGATDVSAFQGAWEALNNVRIILEGVTDKNAA